ncbi:Heart and neural crest derivatives expressed [Cichlidogyrus casuarinus]|uniref:Heart and neural crest derivatives expressed n=1 Tax=Cichlidogyrus casuarinus TaxID=1844966 RepID=A0ABD2QP15_9PLAT
MTFVHHFMNDDNYRRDFDDFQLQPHAFSMTQTPLEENFYQKPEQNSELTDSGLADEHSSRMSNFESFLHSSFHGNSYCNALTTSVTDDSGYESFPSTNQKFFDKSNEMQTSYYASDQYHNQLELRIKTHEELAHYNEFLLSLNHVGSNYPRNGSVCEENEKMPAARVEMKEKRRAQMQQRKEHQRIQDKNRTKALNQAFSRLRECLPEIPRDTKLTKIRTLKHAISYIRELIALTESDSQPFTKSPCYNYSQGLIEDTDDEDFSYQDFD